MSKNKIKDVARTQSFALFKIFFRHFFDIFAICFGLLVVEKNVTETSQVQHKSWQKRKASSYGTDLWT
jgi:hypothetical protein